MTSIYFIIQNATMKHPKNETIVMGNSISSHPFWIFYQWLTLVYVYKIHIVSLIQFILLNLWSIKDGPCRPLPGAHKLHFRQTAFCKNFNILRTICQICSLLNFRVLNQNLMIKRYECKLKLCYFWSFNQI